MKSLNLQNDAILSLTRLFTQPLELAGLLERILEVDAETLHVGRVSIWLYDADHKGIELLDLFESATRQHARGGYLSKADYPTYFAAIDSARVLGIDDVSSDPATAELFEHYLSPLGISSMLDAPIIVEGQSRGVVCHEHVGSGRAWCLAESAFASSIADLIGQAIQTDELRRTRAALRASQERAELIFSSNPVALLLVDRHGTIKEANQKAAELFQCGVEDLHNASVEELIPSHLRERHVRHRQSFNAEPSHRTMASTRELQATTRAGAEIPVEVGLCPITIDGSPQGRTAAFTTPYLTGGPDGQKDWRGEPSFPQPELAAMVKKVYDGGAPLFVHVNGDAAIDSFLEAHRAAAGDDPARPRGTVGVHSQFIRPDQLEKYRAWSITPSFFTIHCFYFGDVHLANRGPAQADRISPLRSARALGLRPSNHTDFNVAPLDQLFTIHTAVNRVSRSGRVLGADERVTPLEALEAVTIDGARQYGEHDHKGSIEPGKLADLVILSGNPLTVDPAAIAEIKVVETIKEGRTIWPRPAAAAQRTGAAP